MLYKIVNTDNYGSDYPDEKFVTGIPELYKEAADEICEVINKHCNVGSSIRYWKVVPANYKLQPGFEP